MSFEYRKEKKYREKMSKKIKLAHQRKKFGFNNQHKLNVGRIGWNKGISRTDEEKQKISRNRMGKAVGSSNPNWKGGITPLRHRIRSSTKMNKWKIKILEKGKWMCKFCESQNELETHHIIPFEKILKENKINSFEKAIKCKKLWDIKNGIVLCKKCHRLT